MGFSQLDAGCEIGISYFIGDAIGSIELTDVAQLGGCTADLFEELAAGGLLW